MVQLASTPEMRGRVMALYMAIFMGGTPIGAPLIGWIGDVWGPRWTIGIGTVAVGLSLVAVSLWLSRRQNVRVTNQSQRRPRLRVTLASEVPDGPRGHEVNFKFRHRITVAALVLFIAIAVVAALVRR